LTDRPPIIVDFMPAPLMTSFATSKDFSKSVDATSAQDATLAGDASLKGGIILAVVAVDIVLKRSLARGERM
jgi:hypothetical protein